jgi:hypothetical protein
LGGPPPPPLARTHVCLFVNIARCIAPWYIPFPRMMQVLTVLLAAIAVCVVSGMAPEGKEPWMIKEMASDCNPSQITQCKV